jgi:hypothetical protein
MSHVCCGKHRLISPASEFFGFLTGARQAYHRLISPAIEFFGFLTGARQAYRLSSLRLVFGRSTHI